jgi:putative peptidoglycan lipid II flippase
MRVPLGIVGQGVGVASFPVLAQLYSEKKFDELNRVLNSIFKGIVFLLVPISALTIAQSLPLVHLVFSHTRLRAPDMQATAVTLAFFSIGMFAWGAQYNLARGFYATRDTITPAVVGTVMTALNLPLYWWLVRRSQHLGLALASSLGIIAYTIVLFVLLNRRTKNHAQARLTLFFCKVTAASVAAGFVCYKLVGWLEMRIPWQEPFGALLLLAIATTIGIVVLAVSLKILRVPELEVYLEKALTLAGRGRVRTQVDITSPD